MAQSVEGLPIISARALRWSDEEVRLVCLFCLLRFISSGRHRRVLLHVVFFVMCRPTEDGDGPTTCVPRPDDTPLESGVRNNFSCIWYPIISLLYSDLPSLNFPSIVSRAIQFPTRANTCLFPLFRVCALCFKTHR